MIQSNFDPSKLLEYEFNQKHLEKFLSNKTNSHLFVGGIDRSGTTKVGVELHGRYGLFIPEIYLATELFSLSSVGLTGTQLSSFYETHQGIYFDNNLNQYENYDIKEFFESIQEQIYGEKNRIIETSPRNLENYTALKSNMDCKFIFCFRDLEGVWSSYKKSGWRPYNKQLFIEHYLLKIKLLHSIRNNEDVFLLKYDDIGSFEKYLSSNSINNRNQLNDELEKVFKRFQPYTIKQHSKVLEPFQFSSTPTTQFEALATRCNFYISSYLRLKRPSRFVRILVRLAEYLKLNRRFNI